MDTSISWIARWIGRRTSRSSSAGSMLIPPTRAPRGRFTCRSSAPHLGNITASMPSNCPLSAELRKRNCPSPSAKAPTASARRNCRMCFWRRLLAIGIADRKRCIRPCDTTWTCIAGRLLIRRFENKQIFQRNNNGDKFSICSLARDLRACAAICASANPTTKSATRS